METQRAHLYYYLVISQNIRSKFSIKLVILDLHINLLTWILSALTASQWTTVVLERRVPVVLEEWAEFQSCFT